MRLGDLDALKEDFKSRLADCNKWIENAKDKETKIRASAVKAFIAEVIMTIDNAPTVFDCRSCKNNGNERECVDCHEYSNFVQYKERPQGEWKETGYETGALGITYRQTQCSNCGWEHALPMWYNFCPNCGAEMRRGDTNDSRRFETIT